MESNGDLNDVILYPNLESESDHSKTYHLAAHGEKENGPFLIKIFSSTEHGIVGRLMQEKSNNHTYLFLISDVASDVQAVKVKLEGIDVEGFTDLQGCIDLGVIDNLDCKGMRIIAPQAVFELAEHEKPVAKEVQKHTFCLKNERLDELQIEIDQTNTHCLYHLHFKRREGQPQDHILEVMAITDQRTIYQEFQKGISIIETEKPEKLLLVRIY